MLKKHNKSVSFALSVLMMGALSAHACSMCGSDNYFESVIPMDTNKKFEKNGDGILYYACPSLKEKGLNRVIRIDANNWTFTDIKVDGVNPHSVDRAGDTDKFYVRTQDSYSFDVVNLKTKKAKTVKLDGVRPRAIGGYNKKHNIQLLSGKNRPTISVIDVATDTVIATLGQNRDYDKKMLKSNSGSGSATGHSVWLGPDHFALTDRVNKRVVVFRVISKDGKLTFEETSILHLPSGLHTIDRVNNPQSKEDLNVFYGQLEGIVSEFILPGVQELIFDNSTGILKKGRRVDMVESGLIINKFKPRAHHSSITPDGKYIFAPDCTGKVYVINRSTMKTKAIIPAGFGTAHVEFSEQLGLAIITNHLTQYVTVADLNTLKVLKNVVISDSDYDPSFNFSMGRHPFMQPHFSYVSNDGKYFYTFASQDGMFIKIDLKELKVIRTMDVGGAPEQSRS